MDRLAENMGITQGLRHYFNPVLNVILQSLDAPPVFMRTKALKALGQILTSDPTILGLVSGYSLLRDSFLIQDVCQGKCAPCYRKPPSR